RDDAVVHPEAARDVRRADHLRTVDPGASDRLRSAALLEHSEYDRLTARQMITIAAADLDAWLTALIYPFIRMLALMSSAPLFSHASVPIPVRIWLALLLTALVAPVLPPTSAVSPLSAAGVLLIFQQLIVGIALGLAMQLVFAAVELAGDMIGLQMGLSFAVF